MLSYRIRVFKLFKPLDFPCRKKNFVLIKDKAKLEQKKSLLEKAEVVPDLLKQAMFIEYMNSLEYK